MIETMQDATKPHGTDNNSAKWLGKMKDLHKHPADKWQKIVLQSERGLALSCCQAERGWPCPCLVVVSRCQGAYRVSQKQIV